MTCQLFHSCCQYIVAISIILMEGSQMHSEEIYQIWQVYLTSRHLEQSASMSDKHDKHNTVKQVCLTIQNAFSTTSKYVWHFQMHSAQSACMSDKHLKDTIPHKDLHLLAQGSHSYIRITSKTM